MVVRLTMPASVNTSHCLDAVCCNRHCRSGAPNSSDFVAASTLHTDRSMRPDELLTGSRKSANPMAFDCRDHQDQAVPGLRCSRLRCLRRKRGDLSSAPGLPTKQLEFYLAHPLVH